ncbi:MAG: L,D-transpeptidase [Rhodobacteraceae bacterium]|nr:L,D-transpeptidase [Paracoccaceae bacterium]
MTLPTALRLPAVLALIAVLSACGGKPKVVEAPPADPRYAEVVDNGNTIAAVDPGYLIGTNARTELAYNGSEAPGTVVVDPYARVLYLVSEGGQATRYGIAVGREGKGFRGDASIRRKEVWPSWTPTANMLRNEPDVYGPYASGLPGGIDNPLGARALYLYRGGKDTHYRIHGTNNASTIGRATSAGCIRLFNQDAIALYDRIDSGTYVHVRTPAESANLEGELVENAEGYMVPVASFPEDVQAQIRAGNMPWPKFVPVIGVNATAPVMPANAEGEVPPAPGT